MKKYIFLISESLYQLNIFSDLENLEDVTLCVGQMSNNVSLNSKIIKKCFQISGFKFFLQSLWKMWFNFDYSENVDYYFVVESGSFRVFPYEIIEKMSSLKNIHLNILLLNSMNASSPNIVDFKEIFFHSCWENVFTYDEYDAKQYNWKYFGMTYFSSPKNGICNKDLSDVYFVGGLKGNRNELILSVFKKMYDCGINCHFDLFCYNDDQYQNRRYPDIINYYTKWKSYDEIQEQIIGSNCIIEILQEGQKTQSLRYFEAVFYNKKLLTNNKNIFNLPFYNQDYMKYFSCAEDIDLEWIKRKDTIDYHYRGEFSTIHLLEFIKNNC